jgi:hypothetical protein
MLLQFPHITTAGILHQFFLKWKCIHEATTFMDAITIAEREQVPTSTQCRMDGLWTEKYFFIIFLSYS